ncbi:MAG: T9SS type A sorting domain-containing protein [Bacteroidales bacterium]|nr:T9SS type A sorting domain-containing protein [Bacteroidales bacterium]
MVSQHELQPGTSQLDLQNLPDGVYFVKEGNGTVKKVVIKR